MQRAVADEIATARRELTDEEFYLVGYEHTFVGRHGEPMYVRARAIAARSFGGSAQLTTAFSAGCRRCQV